MLKTTGSSEKLAFKASRTNSNEVVKGVGGRTNKTVQNSPLSKVCLPNIRATREFEFLIPSIQEFFNQFRPAFIKAPVLWHFDLKYHIRIETDKLGYAISEILS